MMLDQLQSLLSQASKDACKPISHFSLVTDSIAKILPDPHCDLKWDAFEGAITTIFSKNSLATPNKICVVESTDASHDRTFTYTQINRASNLLANHLIKNGVQRGDVVVLYSYRGVDLVVGVIGVLKAGATFSVIDPAYPPPRQNIYLSVAQPRAIVILEKAGMLDDVVEKYIAENLNLVCRISALKIMDGGELRGGMDSNGVDIFSLGLGDESEPGVVLGPDSVATLSFTSGSTGIPKGVRGRHFSLTVFYN